MLTVVLMNPEIPPNTGNIGRLTLGTKSKLTIVGEPTFDISSDAAVKRAGLDYWHKVNYDRYPTWEKYKENSSGKRFLLTKFAKKPYYEANFTPDSHLIFGGETQGVPDKVRNDPQITPICLPMSAEIRAFNICNTVAVVLFEALRQLQPDWFTSTPYSE